MRYRAALLAKTGLLAALGLGLAAALAWRLFMLQLGALWRVGVPAAVIIVTGASLGWWTHSRWPSRRASAAYLDRVLGLKQRLVTAEEFAGAPNAPALYPFLVADASKWVTDSRTRYPRPLDRTTAVLLALLLLVLACPLGGRSPLQQLAQWPTPIRPVQPPAPVQTPPPPPSDPSTRPADADSSAGLPRQPQQQGGASQQPQPSSSAGSQGQRGQGQSPSGGRDQTSTSGSGRQHPSQSTGRDQTSQSPGGQNRQQESSGSGGSSNDGGAAPDRSGGGQQGAGQRRTPSADSAAGGERGQGQSGQGQGQPSSSGRSGSNTDGQPQNGRDQSGSQPSSQSSQSPGTPGSAQAQQARASAGGTSGGDAQAGAGNSQSVEAKAARAMSGGGSSSSPGSEALQQDIQQLLKDVSGEIQTLQAQIAAATGQPPPTAGTTTDPQLYGTSELLGQTGAGNIPIPLKTDATATTSSARAGSGVGRPSAEVAAATPSATPEPAQLSDDPREESPGSRDTVPPEYRDVFERLNRRSPSGI